MITKEFTHEVKRNTDMLELAREYTDMKKLSNGIWQGRCPHPNHDDRTPSFTVWAREQSWCCFGCHQGKKDGVENFGTDQIAFIRWIKGLEHQEAILFLARRLGMEDPSSPFQQRYDENYQRALSYSKQLKGAPRKYLHERGIDDDDIKKWIVGYDGSRIVFPLFDRYRRILGFNTRHFKCQDSPKYINPPNSDIFNKSYYFYGIHLLDPHFNEIRITEGCTDVILAHKYGLKNVVATLGSSLSQGHIDLIKTLKKTPVFCMDGDETGLEKVAGHSESLHEEGIYSKVFILPEDTDLADLALSQKTELETLVQDHSVTYGQYVIQDLISVFDSYLHEVRLQLSPKLEEVVASVPSDREKRLLKDFVRERTGISL